MPNPLLVRSVSSTEQRLNDLRARKARSEAGGGQARIDAQHNRGKMTARERLDMLLDEGTSKRSMLSLNTVAVTLTWTKTSSPETVS